MIFEENPENDSLSEFEALIDGSMEGLQLQTQFHMTTWHLDKADWSFSQDTGELTFTLPDRIVRAPAQIIGSFNCNDDTWLWSWANPCADPSLTVDALKVRAYGEKYGIEKLITPKWEGEELEAWHMTALANRLCESNGAYRGPTGPNNSTLVFFTFGKIEMTGKNP